MINRNNIESKIELINISKKCVQNYLTNGLASCEDADIRKLLTEFNSIKDINEYKKIESRSIHLFKVILNRSRKSKHWLKLLGPLYYILGTCQLAQNKHIEAQISFYELYVIVTKVIRQEKGISCDLALTDAIAMLSQVYIWLNDLNMENINKAGRWYLDYSLLDKVFKEIEFNDPLFKEKLQTLWVRYQNESEAVIQEANNKITDEFYDETLSTHNNFVCWKNIIDQEYKTSSDHQELLHYQELLLDSEYFYKLPLELTLKDGQSAKQQDIQNFLVVSIINLLMANFNLKEKGQTVPNTNYEQIIKIIIKAVEYLPILDQLIKKVIEKIQKVENKPCRFHLLREFKEVLSAAFDQLKISSVILSYPVDEHNRDIDTIILQTAEPIIPQKTQSSAKSFTNINIKSEFISDAKNQIKNCFEEMLTTFSDDINADTTKSIYDFLNDENKLNADDYQIIKNNCITTLKNILKRNIYKSSYWNDLIACLYITIGICQMMEDQYIHAQTSFDEALQVAENTDLYAMTIFLNTFSVYTRLKNDPDIDKRTRALYRYRHDSKLQRIKASQNDHFANNLFIKFEKMFDDELNPSNTNEEVGIELSKNFHAWKFDKKNKRIQEKIIKSKDLCMLSKVDKIQFFTFIIIDQLKDGLNLINMKAPLTADHYRVIANNIKEASKYISISFFIKETLKKIENNAADRYAQTIEFKKVLEILKKDRFGFCSLYDDQNIDSIISRTTSKNLIKPVDMTLTREKFFTSSQIIAKPVLLELIKSVSPQYKVDCQKLINQFLAINPQDPLFNEYGKLNANCEIFINKLAKDNSFNNLNIKKKHGPILDILYYLRAMSLIGKNALTIIHESDLNEILMRPFNDDIKNLSLLTRAYFRLLNEEWDALGDDLKKISGEFVKEAVNSNKEFLAIKEILNQHVDAYTKNNPTKYLEISENIASLNDALRLHIEKNEFKDALNLHLKIEAIYINNKQTDTCHWVNFNFWSTILFFKMREETSDNKIKTKYGDRLSVYLKNALNGDPDSVLEFYKIISSLPNKESLELFYLDYKKIVNDKLNNLTFDHMLKNPHLNSEAIAKSLIADFKKDDKNKQKNVTPNVIEKAPKNRFNKNANRKETQNPSKDRKNYNNNNKKEDLTQNIQTKIVTNVNLIIEKEGPLTKNQKLAIENKKNEYLREQIRETQLLNKNIEAANRKTNFSSVDLENASQKADIENLQRKLTYDYLKNFFIDDFKLLKQLNTLTADSDKYSPPMFKGSFVVACYLNMVHHIKELRHHEYENPINPSVLVTINDIDVFIESIDSLSQDLLATELLKLGFGERRDGFDKDGFPFINLKKDLGNGYTLDITLQIKRESKKLDFIHIGNGIARLNVSNDKNLPVSLSLNDKDGSLNERNKCFYDVCGLGKLIFGVPDENMTSCGYRLFKCLLKYIKFDIDKESLERAKKALKQIYLNSLTNKNNYVYNHVESVYLELHDYIKHDDVELPHELATPIIQLAFEALFEVNNIICPDVKNFTEKYFRKENFTAQTKIGFKNEIDNLILQYKKQQKNEQIDDLPPKPIYIYPGNPNTTFSQHSDKSKIRNIPKHKQKKSSIYIESQAPKTRWN